MASDVSIGIATGAIGRVLVESKGFKERHTIQDLWASCKDSQWNKWVIIKPDSQVFRLLLVLPNGIGVAMLVIQHTDYLGEKSWMKEMMLFAREKSTMRLGIATNTR